MKKNLLFGTCLSLSLGTYAQISIVSTDMPSIGDVITNAQDTMPSVTVGSAGANQSWDFSVLQNHNQTSMMFVDPASTPYAADFPTATMAFENEPGTFAYVQVNSSELAILGIKGDVFGTGYIVNAQMVPKNVVAQFAMNYADDFQAAYTQTIVLPGSAINFPVDSVKIESAITDSVMIDGWGMVTTPTGTYNALRQKKISYETTTGSYLLFGLWNIDSPELDTSISYQWWSNDPGTGFPVVEMSTDSGVVTSASFIVANPPVSVQNIVTPKMELNVFPNPSTTYFVVESNENISSVKVMDLTGKVVLTTKETSSNIRVDVTSLATGNYIIKAEFSNGSVQYQSLEVVK